MTDRAPDLQILIRRSTEPGPARLTFQVWTQDPSLGPRFEEYTSAPLLQTNDMASLEQDRTVALGELAGLAAQGDTNKTLELVAVIGLAVFAVIVAGFAVGLSSARLARRLGDRAARLASRAKALIHQAPVKWNGATFARFRIETIELIRRRWFFLTSATLAGHLTVFLVLLASIRAVGVPRIEVTIVEAFAAWTIARILGAIPITPGGVGFVELGLTGVLVAFGATNAEAVAATLIYRFLTLIPTIGVGLLAAATWKLGQRPTTDGALSR
jgi:uncharacterized membrane protein YbhN (UPF0104 family)